MTYLQNAAPDSADDRAERDTLQRAALLARPEFNEADVLLTRREAAVYLRRSTATLERWSRLGTGPDFAMVESRALYPLTTLRTFVATARHASGQGA